ncbi:LysM peptidoglycan-binding domain-containing protein [Arthrobacter sp. 35W]|uniref:LysM peptidoglycan-binding domain-containing protein n=1 Tax=Arthrobacter sp. 35W TaxID=1132441 RepID=UPI000413C4E0|nr:LysM peptidoglycan-binding domain-containing protein [Arthrobacter sp. 35W]
MSSTNELPPLRLTRRGRLVLIWLPLALVAISLLAAAALFSTPAKAATGSEPIDYATTVTVLSGETLWSIAIEADSSRDTRDVVADIVELNGLSSSVVQPGQRLFVPNAA